MLKGDVSGSLAEFDKAIELDPRQKACRFIHLYFKMCFIYLFVCIVFECELVIELW